MLGGILLIRVLQPQLERQPAILSHAGYLSSFVWCRAYTSATISPKQNIYLFSSLQGRISELTVQSDVILHRHLRPTNLKRSSSLWLARIEMLAMRCRQQLFPTLCITVSFLQDCAFWSAKASICHLTFSSSAIDLSVNVSTCRLSFDRTTHSQISASPWRSSSGSRPRIFRPRVFILPYLQRLCSKYVFVMVGTAFGIHDVLIEEHPDLSRNRCINSI
ncbi:hypothetical protein M3J09_013386 [Ascochyta lentis]